MFNISNIFNQIYDYFKRTCAYMHMHTKQDGENKEKRLIFELGNSKYVLTDAISIRYQYNMHSVQSIHGYKWEKAKRHIRICPSDEPNPHVIIVGMSGNGKSTLIKSLISGMHEVGMPVLVFDAHNEHGSIISSFGGKTFDAFYHWLNIFELGGDNIEERISELTNMFSQVYRLGIVQSRLLHSCIRYTYRNKGIDSKNSSSNTYPNMKDLLNELMIFINNSKSSSERNALKHLYSRLRPLAEFASYGGSISFESILNGVNSFSLSSLVNRDAQTIYINELLKRIYRAMHKREKERGIGLYIIIDEAQFVLDGYGGESSLIRKIFEEGRKYGIGVVIATHMAANLPKQVIANAATFITMYSREPTEINYVANILSGSNPEKSSAIKSMIDSLGINEFILTSRTMKNTYVCVGKSASEFKLAERRNNIDQISALIKRAKMPIRLADLKKVLPKGIDASNLIDSQNNAIERYIADRNGVKELWIMAHNNSISIEHQVNVAIMKEEFMRNGIASMIIDDSTGPDIIIEMDGKKIAVEYETGRKSAMSTKIMLDKRAAEYFKVLVFVNNSYIDRYSGYGSPYVKVFPMSKFGEALEMISGRKP